MAQVGPAAHDPADETVGSIGRLRRDRFGEVGHPPAEQAERYVAAWEAADVSRLLALLAEDATFAMPPLPQWFRGREAIGGFLAGGPFARGPRWRLAPARLNGQLAFAYTRLDGCPHAVDVVDVDDAGRVTGITAFLRPEEIGVHANGHAAQGAFAGRIAKVEFLGAFCMVGLALDAADTPPLVANVPRQQVDADRLAPGSPVTISLPVSAMRVLS